jgi:hypothetical protein
VEEQIALLEQILCVFVYSKHMLLLNFSLCAMHQCELRHDIAVRRTYHFPSDAVAQAQARERY